MVAPDVYRGMPRDRVLLYVAETLRSEEQLIPEFAFATTKGYHVGVILCLRNDQSPAVAPLVRRSRRHLRRSTWSTLLRVPQPAFLFAITTAPRR